MKTVAFIFARGGSKGLPGKNIRDFCGKPLIAWAIEAAFLSEGINRVIVSTDDLRIAEIALHYGADVPFIRPADLAGDESSEWMAWRHALNYLLVHEGFVPDYFLSIPCTAPLRLPSDIDACIAEYQKGECDMVITVTDSNRNPYFNMVTVDDITLNAKLVCIPSNTIARRQDAPECYDMTTVAYVAKTDFVMNEPSHFAGTVRAVFVPKSRAIDIDCQLDFDFAEFLMRKRLGFE
jgi:N-acylneuraminate cytidylyltransferase